MVEQDILLEDIQNKEGTEDVSLTLEQLSSAVLWGTDWTTETIVSQMQKRKIDLNPQFQRREAWDDKRKSVFIESIICGFPIPQIILAEGKSRNDSYIVIDGKQRLLSLRRFFSCPDDPDFKSLKLRGLTILPQLNNKTLEQIKADPTICDIVGQIENQPIRTTIIRNWPNEEFLYNVFLRLNTGSLPLSTQELRQALHPGHFLNFCDEYSVNDSLIKNILHIDKPDYRMRDIELLVRFYSFKYYAHLYTGNLKLFLDDSVNRLNREWAEHSDVLESSAHEMDAAIELSNRIFGEGVFRKWKNNSFDTRFNRAIFDIMVYYFSEIDVRNAAENHIAEIKEAFIRLCNENMEFLSSFETSTKNVRQTICRYQCWGEALSGILGINVNIPNIPYGGE